MKKKEKTKEKKVAKEKTEKVASKKPELRRKGPCAAEALDDEPKGVGPGRRASKSKSPPNGIRLKPSPEKESKPAAKEHGLGFEWSIHMPLQSQEMCTYDYKHVYLNFDLTCHLPHLPPDAEHPSPATPQDEPRAAVPSPSSAESSDAVERRRKRRESAGLKAASGFGLAPVPPVPSEADGRWRGV